MLLKSGVIKKNVLFNAMPYCGHVSPCLPWIRSQFTYLWNDWLEVFTILVMSLERMCEHEYFFRFDMMWLKVLFPCSINVCINLFIMALKTQDGRKNITQPEAFNWKIKLEKTDKLVNFPRSSELNQIQNINILKYFQIIS